MRQLDLMGNSTISSKRVVNVSQVKKLSPFRYPGGKTWLVPTVKQWLSLSPKARFFIEPFTGGGIISLTVAYHGLADRCIMVELDEQVAGVWSVIFSDHYPKLQKKIKDFHLTSESVKTLLDSMPKDPIDKAFVTLVRNRTSHGGILAPGSGTIKTGENGKGIASRWYPKTLIDRISTIYSLKEKIRFIPGDAFDFIRENSENPQATFFIDPPYTVSEKQAGRRLYKCHSIDHETLFKLVKGIKGKFMMTYDDDKEVRHLCEKNNLPYLRVPMKGTHNIKKVELIILDQQSHRLLSPFF